MAEASCEMSPQRSRGLICGPDKDYTIWKPIEERSTVPSMSRFEALLCTPSKVEVNIAIMLRHNGVLGQA